MGDDDDKAIYYPPAPARLGSFDLTEPKARIKKEPEKPRPIEIASWFDDPAEALERRLFVSLRDSVEVRNKHGVGWDKEKNKFIVKDLKLIEGLPEWRKRVLREFLKTNGKRQ